MLLDPSAGWYPAIPIGLQQIVWNLLSNAVKFYAGGWLGRGSSCTATKSDVEIVVKDNGQGISLDFLPFCF